MRRLALILVAPALLAGCGGGGAEGGSDEVTFDLAEQGDSGQSGAVTLTADGERTRVVITLESPPAVPQPAHVHKGSCAELDPNPAYGLANVVDGSSTTVVDARLQELRDGSYAVNVHKSGSELDVYVACADIGSADAETKTDDGGYGDY
jgi:hypothetical protein